MIQSVQRAYGRILAWSEGFMRTDMRYLMNGGLLSLLGQTVSILCTLAFSVVVSHYVPKENYGVYKYITSIVALFSLFSLNSIGSAVFQSAAQGYDGALVKGFKENLRWSIGVFIATMAVGGYYLFAGNSTLGIGILIGGFLSPVLTSASLFSTFLGGKKDFLRQTIYGIWDNVIPIGIFILVILYTQNPLILVLTYLASNTVAALFFYQRTVQVYQANLQLQDSDMLTYSKHLSIMGIMGGLANGLDQILLFHFVGAAKLAVYNFAIALPDQFKGPIKGLASMMQARFVERTDREIKFGMPNKMLWCLAGSIIITIVYIVLAPYIFHTLFPEYIDAVFYSQLYVLWILSLVFEPSTAYLAARKHTRELYVTYISYAIIQIITLLVGVMLWGLVGVILARVVTRLVVNVIGYILYGLAVRRENVTQ
jgi:O-antigen/teichoic acid export membrane protein